MATQGAQIARLVGGAGTGKTTELVGVVERLRERLGCGPSGIGFSSFTKAARREAVDRVAAVWDVAPERLSKHGWFRTVHSICLKQLGGGDGQVLSEDKKSQQWLADALGVAVSQFQDETGLVRYRSDCKPAAQALTCWGIARSRMCSLSDIIKEMARRGDQVPAFAVAKQYVDRYEKAKRADGAFDFADMLSRFAGILHTSEGIEEIEPEGVVPEEVRAWVFDEMQDSSALVDRVCRRLASGEKVERVYLAADPFQAIFGFSGSDSTLFMGWNAHKERVMKKTWRCPAPVLELGERCLKQLKKGYWDRGIAPADHDGDVERGGYVEQVASRLRPEDETLILARCNYTLDAWTALLQAAKIPYLALSEKDDSKALMACNALWQIEHGEPVSAETFAAAMDELPALGHMVRGAKAQWGREETIRQWQVVRVEDLADAGWKQSLIDRVRSGKWADLFWRARRWRPTAVKHGPELATRPAIRLGTVHSTKGMEADTVVLSTPIPRRIAQAAAVDAACHDEERRVEYVGVTRARRRLIIASEHNSEFSMRLPL